MTPVVVIDPDGALAASVTSLLSRDETVEVRRVARPAEVWTILEDAGIVVAGPSLAGKHGLADLRDLHRRAPAVRIVLAFDRRPGGSMRDVVAIGAEALVDPTDAASLRAALELAIRSGRRIGVLATAERVRETPVGRVVTVVSATGGCGKTFLTTALATSLARHADARVAVVDLDLQFGEVAPSLGLRPRTTVVDLVGGDPSEVPDYLEDVLVDHDSGVEVLAAPVDPAQADAVRPALVTAVVEQLRRTHDLVLVDTSTGLSEATLAALDVTDQTVVVSLLDVASIRNLRTLDRTLEQLGIGGDRHLVLNQDRRDVPLTADEVERVLARRFVARIPFSPRVLAASNSGQPVVLDEVDAEVAGPVVTVARAVVPAPVGDRLATEPTDPTTARRWRLPGRRRRARSAVPVAEIEVS